MVKAILIFYFAGHVTSTHLIEPALDYDAVEICQIRGADAVEVINRDMRSKAATFQCATVADQ